MMVSLVFILTALTVIINLALGILVILRRPHKYDARFFFVAMLFIALWSANVAVADTTANVNLALWSVRAAYFNGMMILLNFVLCTHFLIKDRPISRRMKYFSVIIIAFSSLAFSDLVVASVGVTGTHASEIDGPLKTLYILMIAGVFLGLSVRVIKYALSKNQAIPPQTRAQLQLVFLGMILFFMSGLNFNVFYPLITGSYESAKYGPLSTILLTVFCTIAIIKHRLFDIRLVVARSLGYLFSLLAFAALYAVLTFGFARWVIDRLHAPASAQDASYILVALLLALTFNPLRRFFNKLTDTFFYQDRYEPQAVLDKVSSILVNKISPTHIINDVSEVLKESLKPRVVNIRLIRNQKVVGDLQTAKGSSLHKQTDLIHLLLDHNEAVIVQDDLEGQSSVLAAAMQRADIAVAARMQSSNELIGYVLFGYKANGNVYNNQDIKLIRIICDELAVAIQNTMRFEEIARFNETLQREINEATDQLRKSNQKLQQLDTAKDEFISMASHQLRTPLTTVKGYLSMVLEGDAGELTPMQHKLLDEAYASAQRMVGLISDFLNVSRLKTGKFILELVPASLSELVSEELSQLQATAAGRGIALQYTQPDHAPLMKLDENKIRQVIMNLVDNAIYYSKPGGKVDVVLRYTAETVEFIVRDEGIGVPVAELHHLFTKFYRASNARKARPDGTGIGLFMAKKVVAAHGGSIIFESVEGKGSTFGFTLPLMPPKSIEKKLAKKSSAMPRK